MLVNLLFVMALMADPAEHALQAAIMQEQIRQLTESDKQLSAELRDLRTGFLASVEKLSGKVESELKEFRITIHTIDIAFKGTAMAVLLLGLLFGALRLRFRGTVSQDGK